MEEAGWSLDDVLPEGAPVARAPHRQPAQGGTIHDVTAEVHPELCSVAVTAADAIGIPVTGIDLLVPDVTGPEYVFIEANERPGLANHEPQPTAEAFVDFLFPGSPACRRRGHRTSRRSSGRREHWPELLGEPTRIRWRHGDVAGRRGSPSIPEARGYPRR